MVLFQRTQLLLSILSRRTLVVVLIFVSINLISVTSASWPSSSVLSSSNQYNKNKFCFVPIHNVLTKTGHTSSTSGDITSSSTSVIKMSMMMKWANNKNRWMMPSRNLNNNNNHDYSRSNYKNNNNRINQINYFNIKSYQNVEQQQQQQSNTEESIISKMEPPPTILNNQQIDFIIGYMNKHHIDFLNVIAEGFTELGIEIAIANTFSGGSMIIENTQLKHIYNTTCIQLEVIIIKRNNKQNDIRYIDVNLNSNPIKERKRFHKERPIVKDDIYRLPIDDIVRRLCRLSWIAKKPELSGKLIQLAIQLNGNNVGKLPENMFLNQVPHNRYVRQWFYDKVSTAVKDSVILCSNGAISNRMRVSITFPETNPTMDSYRIGTLLELVRSIAIGLAEENIRVRCCVQDSMGVGIFTGLPKQLSGVSRLLQMMDWQNDVNEMNTGILGNYVRFGHVGKQHVMNEIKTKQINPDTGIEEDIITQYQDDVFIIIAPQSMIGTDTSIIPSLEEMTIAAGDRPIILINSDLTDKISSGGQQSIRGRQQRIDFDNSFNTIFHFQNIYISGTSYFPILGAITKLHPINEPYIAHQRRDYPDGDEIYIPVLADETLPDGESIMQCFER